ncbi:hypothetical protein GCM10009865_04530 [Aeromicrobium ponti]|uniref:Uncharacterized protein n=1 Tax=Cytobacillus oceanisediminis TaxID=665099 RepID=A0A562K647_9BACI|nr:hypothetical protein IQ19_00361 [Cytobacillus oceanisediminis]
MTITQLPEMVRYKARFIWEDLIKKYLKVEIMTPEGKVLYREDEELTKEIENKSERKISSITYTPSHVPLGAIEEENIQLVTDASLDKLKEIWGKAEADHRRFRPNLLVTLRGEMVWQTNANRKRSRNTIKKAL